LDFGSAEVGSTNETLGGHTPAMSKMSLLSY